MIMGELSVFFIALIIMSVMDITAMAHSNLKKEIIPYSVLMLIAGALGLYYFTDPYRASFSRLILKLFQIRG